MGCEGGCSQCVKVSQSYLLQSGAETIVAQKDAPAAELINNGQDWRNAVRAREFTIDVPINIRLGDDDDPEVMTPDTTNLVRDVAVVKCKEPAPDSSHDEEMTGTMVPPLQQQIELQKAALGKESEVIDDLTDQDDIDQQEDDIDSQQFVDLSSFWNQRPVGN